MKKLLRKSSVFFILLTFLYCFTISASAYIECDGHINRYEWEDYDEIVLFDFGHPFNNSYHSGSLKYKYIEEDRRVYLGISLENSEHKESKNEQENPCEVYLSFNKSSEIVLRSDLTSDFEESEFFLNYGYYKSASVGESFEAEVVLKELDFDDILTINIQFKDPSGIISQKHSVKIKSEELKEAESVSIAESEKQASKLEKTTKGKSSKTTKEKETTTEFITAVITENYEDYSKTLKQSNNSILIISIVCVVTSLCALLIMLFKKK